MPEEVKRPSEWPATVTTTMEPDRPLEVGPEEWLDLKRQHLLADDGVEKPATVRRAREARVESQE